MTDSSVRVPVAPSSLAGKEVDCDSIERDGVTYYRQRVLIAESALPTGAASEVVAERIAVESVDTSLVLGKILKELRLISAHLASMTGESITKDDLS